MNLLSLGACLYQTLHYWLGYVNQQMSLKFSYILHYPSFTLYHTICLHLEIVDVNEKMQVQISLKIDTLFSILAAYLSFL